MSTSRGSRGLLMGTALAALLAGAAQAQEISRWTDENGQVHFGNHQFAPQDRSERIDVEPANGMAAPDTRSLYPRRATRPGRMVYVPHNTENRHLKGWRGYDATIHHNRTRHQNRR